MPNNSNHIDQPDFFSQILKDKLENHQLPVDAECWNQIEKRMKPKRKVLPWWWLTIGSAAVIALLLTLQPFSNRDSFTDTAKNGIDSKTTIESTQQVTNNITQIKKSETSINTNPEPKTQLESTPKTNKQPVHKTSLAVYTENNGKSKIDTGNNDKQINLGNDLSPTNAVANETTVKDTSVIRQPRILPEYLADNLNEEPVNEPVTLPESKSEWLLAAAFGSGGSTSFSGSNLEMALSDYNIVAAKTQYTSILTPNDFSDITHFAPISFGLVARKNLDKTWSIESGIMYTYLFSTFANTGTQPDNATLKLHYMGIPLNVVARVWNNPKWEVYISAGGMVEKGLRSIYTQNIHQGNRIVTTQAGTNIDGLQWSVNTAIGTTYNLQRNIGIYFEPKLSYYLENNQPLSARTDQPLNVGLTAGVRFRL